MTTNLNAAGGWKNLGYIDPSSDGVLEGVATADLIEASSLASTVGRTVVVVPTPRDLAAAMTSKMIDRLVNDGFNSKRR